MSPVARRTLAATLFLLLVSAVGAWSRLASRRPGSRGR